MARTCEYCADAVRTRPGSEHVQCATCGRRCTVLPEQAACPYCGVPSLMRVHED